MLSYKKRRIGCFTIIGIILIYGTIRWFMTGGTSWDQPFMESTGTICGTVITNYTEIRQVKHGTATDYYMKIDYGNTTGIRSVDGSTWYEYQPGSTVCFETHKSVLFFGLCAIVTFFVVVCTILVYFCEFIFGDIKFP